MNKVILLILLSLFSPILANAGSNLDNKCSGLENCTAFVAKVVDGDTIVLSTGEKVRYIGVDTPETHHPFKKVECFGQEAFQENKSLVENKEIRLEKDVSDKDKYGRLLRYVYVGDIFVNDYLARSGYASSATFPPDIKFQEQFQNAESEARKNNRGLWSPGLCEEKTNSILDKRIKDKIYSVKKYYPAHHQGFRESLINDIQKEIGGELDRIGFFVYTLLKDIK